MIQGNDLHHFKMPEGWEIRTRQQFELITPNQLYDIELFGNSDGTFYAIGVPRDADRVTVYGSSVVKSEEQALQMVLARIQQFGSSMPTNEADE